MEDEHSNMNIKSAALHGVIFVSECVLFLIPKHNHSAEGQEKKPWKC